MSTFVLTTLWLIYKLSILITFRQANKNKMMRSLSSIIRLWFRWQIITVFEICYS